MDDTDQALALWREEGAKPSSRDARRAEALPAALHAAEPGLGKAELTLRLGPPHVDHGSEWVYVVAPGALVRAEMRLMAVAFDAGGRVARAWATTTEDYAPPA